MKLALTPQPRCWAQNGSLYPLPASPPIRAREPPQHQEGAEGSAVPYLGSHHPWGSSGAGLALEALGKERRVVCVCVGRGSPTVFLPPPQILRGESGRIKGLTSEHSARLKSDTWSGNSCSQF